ncbi:Fungal specific transcription factor domain [Ceratobasidium sp. AG-Ba]|nr:Fungal specific transcription factor domain [Ceratobasidium sp. AG-Ba]
MLPTQPSQLGDTSPLLPPDVVYSYFPVNLPSDGLANVAHQAQAEYATAVASMDTFQYLASPYSDLSHSAQIRTSRLGSPELGSGPSTSLQFMSELENASTLDNYRSSSTRPAPRLLGIHENPVSINISTIRDLAGSATWELEQIIPSTRTDRELTCHTPESKDEPTARDDSDSEGAMEIISPVLALDRNVASNSLPYILSSYLKWMTQTLFEPMTVAYMVRDHMIWRYTTSDDLRYATTLGATIVDLVVKEPALSLGNFSEMTLLENRLSRELSLAESGLESWPETYQNNALITLCDVYEMMMIRSLSSSMSFQLKILDQIAPVYLLVCAKTPRAPIHLQSRILHPNTAFRQAPAMDILLSLSTCRPMTFRYDTVIYELGSNANRIGLQWKSGIPDEALIMLCQMNALRQDRTLVVDPAAIESIEAWITVFEPVVERSPDSYLYIAREVVQECWRQFLYIYLYMGLCNANCHDPRVKKALKRFIKVLDQVKPGRIPDSFLVTPMSLAGIAAYKKRDRDIIRGRLCGLYECSQPGTYVNDALRIMEEVWSMANIQNRPSVWSDLRPACFAVTGIV